MDWNGWAAAIAGALATVAGSVVWSVVDRRRAATEALVTETLIKFGTLLEAVATSSRALFPLSLGKTWSHELVDAENARTRLLVHLSPGRWRSERLGLRLTLEATTKPFREAAEAHAAKDSAKTEELLINEINVVSEALAAWIGRRKTYWRGNIIDELRQIAGRPMEAPVARGPRWWRWLRPAVARR